MTKNIILIFVKVRKKKIRGLDLFPVFLVSETL